MSGLIRMAAALVAVASLAYAAPLPQASAGKGWKSGSNADTCYLQTPVVGSATASAVRFGQGVFDRAYSMMLVGPKQTGNSPIDRLVVKIGTIAPEIRYGSILSDPADPLNAVVRVKLTDDEAKRVIDGEPVVLSVYNQAIVNLSTVLLSRGTQRLTDCREKQFRDVGLDVALVNAPAIAPSGDIQRLFKDDDYPKSALRDGASGSVGVAFVVGTNGRVKDCRITSSSHSTTLDRVTCEIIQRRGKFSPARDASGRAIDALKSTLIGWRVWR